MWATNGRQYQVRRGGPWCEISIASLVGITWNIPGLLNTACTTDDILYRRINEDDSLEH
jgi:hypothetical protein